MDSEGNCTREPEQPAEGTLPAVPKFYEVNPWLRRCRRPFIICLCVITGLCLMVGIILMCIFQNVVHLYESLIIIAIILMIVGTLLAITYCCAYGSYRTRVDQYVLHQAGNPSEGGLPIIVQPTSEGGLPIVVHPLIVHDLSTGGAHMVVHSPAPEFPMKQQSGQFNDPPPPYSNVVTEPLRTDISGRVSPYHMSQKEQSETYPTQANPPSYPDNPPYNPYISSPYSQTQGSYLPLYDPLLSPGRTSLGRTSPGRISPGRMSPGRTSPGMMSPGRASPYHLSHEKGRLV